MSYRGGGDNIQYMSGKMSCTQEEANKKTGKNREPCQTDASYVASADLPRAELKGMQGQEMQLSKTALVKLRAFHNALSLTTVVNTNT